MFNKRLILLVTLFSLGACTSMRTVDLADSGYADRFETGDHLIVYEKYGRIIDMKLAQVDNGVLYGSLSSNGLTPVEVALEDVSKIEIEKISGAKTTGAVVGGIALLPIVAAGAVLGVAASGS